MPITTIPTNSGLGVGDTPLATIAYEDYQATLANSAEIDSGWLDTAGIDKYQIQFYATTTGLSLVIESRDNASQSILSSTTNYTASTLFFASLPARQRYLRFRLQNNSGSSIPEVSLVIKFTYGSSDKASVFPIAVAPAAFSQAVLTQSVLTAKDTNNTFQNVGINQVGALLAADFGTEVSRNLYDGYSIQTKFGRNPDIDTGSTPEDMWNGGGEYTGFNAVADENVSVVSADNDDRGSLVSSGTATGGSSTTLIDSSATFISDGVAVGDIVLNDTQGIHGHITSVDGETSLTVFRMTDSGTSPSNAVGDSYRIATAIDSGAAVLQLSNILSADFTEQTPVYVILNGTTAVTGFGSFCRCSRGKIVLAGSTGLNEGVITVNQAVTTANVFARIPTYGQSTICAVTVPAGKIAVIKGLTTAITRTSGSAGSATVLFNTREFGGAWNAKRVYEAQTGAIINEKIEGGIIIPSGSDMKYTITDVSDNNTVAQGSFEYYLIDEN